MAVKTGVTIKDHVEELVRLEAGFRFLKNTDVLVGIPQEKNEDHGGITNAELLFIHTNGAPSKNIPARPTIQPAIQEPATRKRLQELLKRGLTLALTGNTMGAEKVYRQAGQIGMNAAKAKFGAVGPPLKPATVARKGSSATLIDNGDLRDAITFVVRKK